MCMEIPNELMLDVEVLRRRVQDCRDRWEPVVEDSIVVTYGGYQPHDGHCGKCKPLIAVLAFIESLDGVPVP